MQLVTETYHSWGAEVVFITSNFQGNGELMEGCKKAGIPAFVSELNFWISNVQPYPCAGDALGFLDILATR
jgi:hypothetical protein